MAESEYWRLELVLSDGTLISLLGDEEDFVPVMDAFVNGENFGRKKICGITDTADRAPMFVAIDPEALSAITLVKLYG